MIKYNLKWKNFYNYSFKSGGINMYMKTNLKEEKSLGTNTFNDYIDEACLDSYFKITMINDFIDKIVEELFLVFKNEIDSESKLEWLKDWKFNRKEKLFGEIYQIIISNSLNKEKLTRLDRRIDRYFKYLDLIYKENNSDKYEEIFNTIIEIPSEIYNFIKEGIAEQKGKFLKKEYSYSDNKISSSKCLEDDILNIIVYYN